jgi:hypothetical protein
VTATSEFQEIERLRHRARHDEISALRHAREQGAKQATAIEREKWQGELAKKDAVVAEQSELIAKLQAQLTNKNP